jgi:hypothetical protein
LERLTEARERLSRVRGVVTPTAVRDASREHPGHAARLVADLSVDVFVIANALGLTVLVDPPEK